MTQGRIPVSRISDYGQRHEWPSDLIVLFTEVILALDRAYLSWCLREQARRAESNRSA